MSQSKQQEQGAAPSAASVPKKWELFWRMIAGLMLMIIAWTAWVLYQIMPRSVATPLAYEFQVKPVGIPATGAAGTAPQSTAAPAAVPQEAAAAVPQPAPGEARAAPAIDAAQAGARSGAHQSSADVQAAASREAHQDEQFSRERLKLSTEITTPLLERKSIPK